MTHHKRTSTRVAHVVRDSDAQDFISLVLPSQDMDRTRWVYTPTGLAALTRVAISRRTCSSWTQDAAPFVRFLVVCCTSRCLRWMRITGCIALLPPLFHARVSPLSFPLPDVFLPAPLWFVCRTVRFSPSWTLYAAGIERYSPAP